jgi:hypothetical protein
MKLLKQVSQLKTLYQFNYVEIYNNANERQ